MPARGHRGTKAAPRQQERLRRDGASAAVIWERHRPTIERQVSTLEAAVCAVGRGTFDSHLRLEAQHAAHNLTGSAGTFGYPEASEAARRLEGSFRSEAVIRPEQADSLRQVVLTLRHALSQEADQTGGGRSS